MATISSLFVTLSLQAETFNQGLRDSQAEAKQFEKDIKPTVTAAKELGEAMSVVGDLIAATMIEVTKKTAEYGAEVEHLHDRSGVAVDDLQKLSYAATLNGSSMDGLAGGLKKLSTSMEQVTNGGSAQIKAYANLGISAKDVADVHGNAAAMFSLVADKIKGMDDPSTHAADLTKVLGKSWTDLIPTLQLGSDGLQALGDQAEKTGKVMGEDAVQQAAAFHKSMLDLETSVEGVGVGIGTQLMPMLSGLIGSITDGVQWIGQFVKAHEDITKAVFGLAAAIGAGGGLLLSLAGILLVWPQLVEAFTVITGPIGLTVLAIGALAAAAVYFRKEIAEGLLFALSDAMSALAGFIGAASSAAYALGMDGLASKLDLAKISVIGTSKELDTMGTSLMNDMDHSVKAAEAHKDHADALDLNTKAATAFEKAVQNIIDSVTEETRRGPELVAALSQMTNAHIDDSLIVDKLGAKIITYTDGLVKEGKQLDAVTQYYRDLALRRLADNDAAAKQWDALVKINDILTKNAGSMKDVAAADATMNAQMSAADKNYIAGLNISSSAAQQFLKATAADELKDHIDLINQTIAGDTTYSSKMRDLAIATRDIKKATDDAYNAYHQSILAIMQAADEGASADTLKAMQQDADLQLAVWKTNSTELLKLGSETTTTQIADRKRFYISEDQARQTMETSMAQSMGAISTGIASDLADSITHWTNFGDAIKKTAQNAADSMLKAMLDGFMTPLTNELTKLGAKIADSLSGLVGGGSSAATSAAGGASTAASGAASGASSAATAASTAATGVLGIVNAVSGIASAIGSLGTMFETMRLEGTMNAVEHNTRYLSIDFENTMGQIWWPQFQRIENINDRVQEIINQIDAVFNLLSARLSPAAAGDAGSGNGAAINLNVDGKTFARLIAPSLYSITRDEGVQIVGVK